MRYISAIANSVICIPMREEKERKKKVWARQLKQIFQIKKKSVKFKFK